ncbi:hypothetical protein HispidOSU_027322 [Sigmodon hispidus]
MYSISSVETTHPEPLGTSPPNPLPTTPPLDHLSEPQPPSASAWLGASGCTVWPALSLPQAHMLLWQPLTLVTLYTRPGVGNSWCKGLSSDMRQQRFMPRAPWTGNKLDLSPPHRLVEAAPCFSAAQEPLWLLGRQPGLKWDTASQETGDFEGDSSGFWGARSPQVPMGCRQGTPA